MYLVLASQLDDISPETIEKDDSRNIAMMVVERHRRVEHDLKIERFCENIPFRIQLGYFVSLDDEFIQRILGADTVKLMENLGMNESELVSSIMLSRRIRKMQARFSREVLTDHDADSPEEWFRLNVPTTDTSTKPERENRTD